MATKQTETQNFFDMFNNLGDQRQLSWQRSNQTIKTLCESWLGKINIEHDHCQKYSDDNVKIRELIEREIKMMSSVQEGFETSASNQHTKVQVLWQSISNLTNRKDQALIIKLKLSIKTSTNAYFSGTVCGPSGRVDQKRARGRKEDEVRKICLSFI